MKTDYLNKDKVYIVRAEPHGEKRLIFFNQFQWVWSTKLYLFNKYNYIPMTDIIPFSYRDMEEHDKQVLTNAVEITDYVMKNIHRSFSMSIKEQQQLVEQYILKFGETYEQWKGSRTNI